MLDFSQEEGDRTLFLDSATGQPVEEVEDQGEGDGGGKARGNGPGEHGD